MNIRIHSVNFEVTPAIDDYVSKKISSLSKFLDGNENILCEMELGRTTGHHKSGDVFRAEINMVLAGGKQVYAVAEEADLYAAIDIVRDEAERVVVSQKSKRTTVFRRGAAQVKALLKRLNFRKK